MQQTDFPLYVTFTGGITSEACNRLCALIIHAIESKFAGVYVGLTSTGGIQADASHIYSILRSLTFPITFHNTGTLSSSAVTLSLGAGRRISSVRGLYFLHPIGMSGLTYSGEGGASALQKGTRLQEAVIDGIFAERTRLPAKLRKARRVTEIWLSAQEALRYGLVDELAEFSIPDGAKAVVL
jgi:ATP-dependent Clp protease protease subunit